MVMVGRGWPMATWLALWLGGCSALPGMSPQAGPVTVTVSVTPTPASTSPELGDVLNAATTSVGRIISSTCDELPAFGSGFLVADDLVLTAAHVAANASELTMEFPDHEPVNLEVVYSEPAQDTALLRLIDPVAATPLQLSDNAAMAGQQVGVVGYPLGYTAPHVNSGMVSSVDDEATLDGHLMDRLVTLDAAVNPGNSGGPVLNVQGEVVGLITSSAASGRVEGTTAEGIHFAIPVDRLRPILDEWADSPAEAFTPCDEPTDSQQLDTPILELLLRTPSDDAQTLGGTLWVHGEAINQGKYEAAWKMLTPAMQARMGGLQEWSEGLDSSYWVVLEIREASITDTRASVTTFLRTYQDPRDGRDGQTCTIWPLTYTMAYTEDEWLIDRAKLRADPEPCQQ